MFSQHYDNETDMCRLQYEVIFLCEVSDSSKSKIGRQNGLTSMTMFTTLNNGKISSANHYDRNRVIPGMVLELDPNIKSPALYTSLCVTTGHMA